MLLIDSFSKRFDETEIVSISSLELPCGVYLVKGANGSGKTTFFKCLAGLAPFSGNITFDGTDLRKDPVGYRRKVNYAEAEPLYPPFLTARDLMHFVGATKGSREGQIEYYAEAFGVEEYYYKACGTYSSGMLKKLSLALAFLGEPRMIILDEPLITLDEPGRRTVMRLVSEKPDTFFFLSTHQAPDDNQLDIARTFRIVNKTFQEDGYR